jgi:hypothetical protein
VAKVREDHDAATLDPTKFAQPSHESGSPMRAAAPAPTTPRRPATRYPRFRRDPFARDVAFDPGGTTMPRIAALHMLRSTMKTVSAHHFVAQSHTPRTRCVRFVFGVTAASRNTRFQAARYGLAWARLSPADRASFAWRLPSSITSSARASIVGGISKWSVRAVLRLITNSNFVGCWTGRSAGLAPLRIIST